MSAPLAPPAVAAAAPAGSAGGDGETALPPALPAEAARAAARGGAVHVARGAAAGVLAPVPALRVAAGEGEGVPVGEKVLAAGALPVLVVGAFVQRYGIYLSETFCLGRAILIGRTIGTCLPKTGGCLRFTRNNRCQNRKITE